MFEFFRFLFKRHKPLTANSALRFATEQLSAAPVSKPNSFLTPIVCYKGCKYFFLRRTGNFQTGPG
ncbi:MAG: hypothetical protein OXB86_06140 [Bdellovibrionales bacterium]|nr:hypothetical protein [Bdellovibrionales bacterium]